MTDTIAAIRECLPENLPFESIAPGMTFESIRMDSLDFVQFIVDLEERLDVEIPNQEAKKFKTIGDVMTCLETAQRLPL